MGLVDPGPTTRKSNLRCNINNSSLSNSCIVSNCKFCMDHYCAVSTTCKTVHMRSIHVRIQNSHAKTTSGPGSTCFMQLWGPTKTCNKKQHPFCERSDQTVYNEFPAQSGKRLQRETLDLGSRLIDL